MVVPLTLIEALRVLRFNYLGLYESELVHVEVCGEGVPIEVTKLGSSCFYKFEGSVSVTLEI